MLEDWTNLVAHSVHPEKVFGASGVPTLEEVRAHTRPKVLVSDLPPKLINTLPCRVGDRSPPAAFEEHSPAESGMRGDAA